MQHKYSRISMAMFLAMGLSACGGSGNSGNSQSDSGSVSSGASSNGSYSVVASVQGANADYASDALVCVDSNSNGVCDADDAGGVYTDNSGKATLRNLSENELSAEHNLIAVLRDGSVYKSRVDSSRLDFNSKSGIAGQVAVNPMSTIAASYAEEKGLSIQNAKNELAQTLGTEAVVFDDTLEKGSAPQVFVQGLSEKKVILNANVIIDNDGVISRIDTALIDSSPESIVDFYLANGNFNTLSKITKFANNLPEVAFTSAVTDCRTISFNASATDADNDTLVYRWNFGDGSAISKQQNPTHTYALKKTFDVMLSVSDTFGETNVTHKVKIDNSRCGSNAASLFSFQNRPSDPFVVEFSDMSTGEIVEYFWDFGDEQTSSLSNPVHKYDKAGTYNVSLTVKYTDGRIINSDLVPVTVGESANSLPVPMFEVRTDGLRAEIVNKSYDKDGDSLSYRWIFSDGTESTEINPTHYFATAGTKSATLMVSDGKITTSLTNVFDIVAADDMAASIVIASSSDQKVVLNAVTRNASDSAVYSWTMGDGTTLSGKSVTHTYARTGVYDVVLTVQEGDKAVRASKVVRVSSDSANHAPVIDSIVSAVAPGDTEKVLSFVASVIDADNDELVYSWDFGDGEKSELVSPVHTYAAPGTYTVKLTVSDGKESTVFTRNVTIAQVANHAPVADFQVSSKDLLITCKDASYDEDGDNLTYKWDFGDGSSSSDRSPSHTYAKNGTYTVTMTVTDGKLSSAVTREVTVQSNTVVSGNHAPVADFHYKFTGLSGVLTAAATDADKDELSYVWNFGDGLTSTEKNPKVTYKTGGEKTITLTVSDGKTSSEPRAYKVTLAADTVKIPQKSGIYYKGDADGIYIWAGTNVQLTGSWPGTAMTKASESADWSFYDTSAISYDSINMIFLKGGNKLTGDITNAPVTGCYDNGQWTTLDSCQLAGSQTQVVEGGASLSSENNNNNNGGEVGQPSIVIGDITWNSMDYAKTIASSDVRVASAPYVTTDLAPGSYHEDKTVTLGLQDADFRTTGGTIYYTLDNSVPTESSARYTGPIELKDTSKDGLGTAYRLRTLSVGENGMKQEQHFFWFIKKNGTIASATDFRDETIYFVLTARYKDGDESNNYYDRDRYDATDPSWRGDFKGLIDSLDYIKSMGFTAIWITPPVENRSGLDYHGYHAYDWFQPDLRLESPGATYFDFIKAAHAKGIKVIQDVVVNHSSNYGIRGQAWIEKIPTKYYIDPKYGKNGIDMGGYQKNIGDYQSINRCDNDNPVAPAWHRSLCAGDPNAEATFTVHFAKGDVTVTGDVNSDKGIDARYFWNPAVQNYLPEKWYHVGYTNNWEAVDEVQLRSMAGDCVDLKTEDKVVQDYMNSMMKMYLDMGVDAIRMDTMKHMPREDLKAMTDVWRAYKKNLFVFGEALIKGYGDNTPNQLHPWFYTRTSGPAETPSGDSGISALDFPLMSQFRNTVRSGSLGGLAEPINAFDAKYADPTKLVTFFQNHDLSNDNTWSGSGARMCCDDPAQMALGMNVLWFFRGIPVMYAGDENNLRAGMTPDLAGNNDLVGDTGRLYIGDEIGLGKDKYGIVAHMADLNAIRKASIAMRRGGMKILNGGDPMVFERTYESENAIVAMTGSGGASVTVTGATDGTYTDLVTGAKYTVSGGSVNLGNIPAYSARVLVKNFSGTVPAMKGKFLK